MEGILYVHFEMEEKGQSSQNWAVASHVYFRKRFRTIWFCTIWYRYNIGVEVVIEIVVTVRFTKPYCLTTGFVTKNCLEGCLHKEHGSDVALKWTLSVKKGTEMLHRRWTIE